MTFDEHCKLLGGLMANFHSLELCLRVFLNRLPNAHPMGIPHGKNIYAMPIGTELPVNDLTNYESLGQLIERYNCEVVRRKLGKQINKELVATRDALAHGRVSSDVSTDNSAPMRLIKFSKPAQGKTKIEFNAVLDTAWFTSQRKKAYAAIMAVYASYEKLTKQNTTG